MTIKLNIYVVVVDWIEENKDKIVFNNDNEGPTTVKSLIEFNEKYNDFNRSFDEYIRDMRKNPGDDEFNARSWGDYFTLAFLARICNVNIIVFHQSTDKTNPNSVTLYEPKDFSMLVVDGLKPLYKSSPPIILAHVNGNHFVSVKKINDI